MREDLVLFEYVMVPLLSTLQSSKSIALLLSVNTSLLSSALGETRTIATRRLWNFFASQESDRPV
jgi:hypothetical protein